MEGRCATTSASPAEGSPDRLRGLKGVVTLSTKSKKRPHLQFQVAATTLRHTLIAEARKVRCVRAETRWRWTLTVL
jgi:hypothetical protein